MSEHNTVIVLAVKWRGVVRTVRWAWERHKDQGGSAFVHAITAFVGATTLTSAEYPLAPTAVHPFGIIVRAWPSFPGSEIYITTYYSTATSYISTRQIQLGIILSLNTIYCNANITFILFLSSNYTVFNFSINSEEYFQSFREMYVLRNSRWFSIIDLSANVNNFEELLFYEGKWCFCII